MWEGQDPQEGVQALFVTVPCSPGSPVAGQVMLASFHLPFNPPKLGIAIPVSPRKVLRLEKVEAPV